MASDRTAAQATGNAAPGGGQGARLLAALLAGVGVLEAAWLDAFVPPGWPAWLSTAPVLVLAAGLWLRVDRRRWAVLATGLALASLGLAMVAWPGTDAATRSVAPWLAALVGAVGLGGQVAGRHPGVSMVARAAGGLLLALVLLALRALVEGGGKALPLGIAPLLAWGVVAAWLLVRDLEPGPQRMLRLCSALLAGLALLVMAGWWLQVPYIVQGGTRYVPMQFNTAFCAFLMAMALRLLATGRRNLALLPLLPVVLLALVSLAEEYAGWAVGAGEWLLRHGIVAEGVVPGRMAPNTATAFLLGILGVVLAPPGGQRSPVRWSATWACGFVVTVIALIVITGYVFGIPVLRGWGSHTPMALMTGLSMALIGIGLGFGGAEIQRTLRQRAAWMPVVVALGATAASVLMWYAIDLDQGRRERLELEQRAELVRRSIETGEQDRSDALRRMAERLGGASDEDERQHLFRLDSAIYLRDFPSFASVLWVDPETRVKGVLQREGYAAAVLGIRLDFEQVRAEAFARARRSGMPEKSRPIVLLNGRPGELLIAPVVGAEGFMGYVAAAVMHDDLYPRVLATVAEESALRIRHGTTLLYQRGTPGAAAPLVVPIEGPDDQLAMEIWPADQDSGAPLANLLLFTGLLGGGLLALALRLAGLARERAEEAERKGAELACQMAEAERARAALGEAEQELSQVFGSISDAFYTLDRDWRFVFVNPRAEQLMQRPREALVGTRVWDAFPEARGSVVEREFRDAVGNDRAREFEVHFPPLSAWFYARVFPHPHGLAVYFQDISERKRAEAGMQKARAASERAQQIAQLGSWEYDLATGELAWSPEVLRIFGLPRGQARHSLPAMLQLVHFEDRGRLQDAQRRLHAGEAELDIEYRIVRPDGETRFVRELGTLVRDESGTPVAASGAIQDVTQRHQSEDALRELSRRLEQSLVMNRLVLENSLDVICVIDANGRFTQVSSACQALWGFMPGELVGRAYFDLAHPDDRANTLREGAAVLAGRPTVDFRNRVLRKDGSVVSMQWSAVWSPRERLMFAVARDVTEVERHANALREAKESLQRAQQVARMGAWELEIASNELRWSDEVYSIFHIRPGEFEGTFEAFAARVYPEDLARLQAAQQRLLEGGPDMDVEHRIVLPEGGVGHVHERARVLRGEDGRPWLISGSVQDITERKRARQLEAGQRSVLASIAARRPLTESLLATTRVCEEQFAGALCSILLLDEGGQHVLQGAAPSLPAAYNAAVDGLAIGPKAGSCGTAAWRGERVVVSDIDTDPLWEDYRGLAHEHGLRACWSTPVKSSSGKVLATFATYYREPREPTPAELATIDGLASLVAVAIEHAEAYRNLELGEQRFRSLFDEHPDAVYSLDLEGRYTSVNDSFAHLAGVDPAQVIGQRFDERTAPEQREVVRAHFDAACRGEARSYEMTGLAVDGARVELRVTNLPIVVEGQVTGVFGIAQDISLLHKHQRELSGALDAADQLSRQLQRLSEASIAINRDLGEATLYQQLVDKVREIVGAHQAVVSVVADDDGKQLIDTISLSDKYAQWRDYDVPIDCTGIYMMVGEQQKPVRMSQAELEAHPRWRGFGDEASRHPPMRGWLAVPLVGSDGKTLGILQLSDKYRGEFSADDEQVAMQFAQMAVIAIERARLLGRLGVRDRFFEMSLEVFVVFDPASQRFVQVNPMLSEITGYSREELCSREIQAFVHPDDWPKTGDRAAALADRRGVPTAFVNRYVRRDGGVRWMEWMSSPADDGLVYAVGRDITERLRAEAALRQTLADLNNRNRELQDFAFIASHDLQEPLRKIRAFADRLQQRHAEGLAAEARDYLDRTSQAAARMQVLIDDLLAYSRVAARGKPFKPVDLGQVLAGVLDDLEAALESSGGRVVVPGPLPTLEGDPTQLRQVFQNLLSNALKFRSPDRAPVVTITAEPSPAEDGPGWILRFEDNGIGFEPRHAEKVFGPFQRLHARQEYAGTGIGLAIVRRIVERHRGLIHAEGRPGEGATFVIRLPQTQPADPALLAGPMAES